jgi:translation initiation factor IF-1
MAGLGRRSHYRKHLTDAVLHDLPEPEQGECIAKVVATRGGNQFDVLVAGGDTPRLAILPTKFHKLIWVKRGDFCIVRTGDESAKEDECSGVRYLITHVLYKDQVKHLKSKKLWPDDEQFATLENNTEAKEVRRMWTMALSMIMSMVMNSLSILIEWQHYRCKIRKAKAATTSNVLSWNCRRRRVVCSLGTAALQ